MAFNRDITNLDITTHGVVSCPDRMTGTAQQNKQRFDELVREVVKEKFNGLLDDLEASTAAENIGFSAEGYEANNVKDAILEVEDIISEAVEDAEENALKSEGYAVGKQNGTPVSAGEPYYKDNAKYYKERAEYYASFGIFQIIMWTTTCAEIEQAMHEGACLVLVKYPGLQSCEIYFCDSYYNGIMEWRLTFLSPSGGGYLVTWGVTDERPTYTYVYSGIEKEQLSNGVQTSLGKADTALQPGDFTKVASTMAAASWSGSTYSFEGTYPAANYDITVEPASTATSEQYKAFAKAMLAGNALTNVLTAIGTVPTVDIPIIITAMAK